jgi:LysR family transcriptional regulator, regulator for metE and metH
MIDIKYLRLIETVATEGSLSGAARKLFLTQSALSHQLKEIEIQMGTQAFHRVNKKLVITPAGNTVLAAARKILPLVENIDLELKKIASGEIGQLRLCTECYTCYHWLPALIKKFNLEYPNIDIQIITENVNDPLALLREGKVDLALVSRPEKDNNLEYVELFKDEMVLLMSSRDPLTQYPVILPDHFSDQVLITHSAKGKQGLIFKEVLNPAGIEVRKIVYVQLTEAVVEMVKAGIGIAVLPKWTLKPYLLNGNLAIKKITKRGMIRKWSAATLKTSKKIHHIQFFTQLLKNEIMV